MNEKTLYQTIQNVRYKVNGLKLHDLVMRIHKSAQMAGGQGTRERLVEILACTLEALRQVTNKNIQAVEVPKASFEHAFWTEEEEDVYTDVLDDNLDEYFKEVTSDIYSSWAEKANVIDCLARQDAQDMINAANLIAAAINVKADKEMKRRMEKKND